MQAASLSARTPVLLPHWARTHVPFLAADTAARKNSGRRLHHDQHIHGIDVGLTLLVPRAAFRPLPCRDQFLAVPPQAPSRPPAGGAAFSQQMSTYLLLAGLLLTLNRAGAAGAGVVIIAAVLLLPVALVLLSGSDRRRGGPSWADLGGSLRPSWMRPMGRPADRAFALLTTGSGQLVLIRHNPRRRRRYYTLPGGRVRLSDAELEATLSRWLAGLGVDRVEPWSLVHIDRGVGHQDRVFAARLVPADLDTLRAASGGHMQLVTATASTACGLDLRPRSVARAMRHIAYAGGDPMSMPDLREG